MIFRNQADKKVKDSNSREKDVLAYFAASTLLKLVLKDLLRANSQTSEEWMTLMTMPFHFIAYSFQAYAFNTIQGGLGAPTRVSYFGIRLFHANFSFSVQNFGNQRHKVGD